MTSGLAASLEADHAMPRGLVQSILIDPVRHAEEHLCMDLQTHLHEKRSDFNVMSVHTLAEHVRLRSQAAYQDTLAQAGQTTEAITVVAGELERQEWEPINGKIEYGRHIIKAYRWRCSDKDAMN